MSDNYQMSDPATDAADLDRSEELYYNRGLSRELVARVMARAYDQSHSGGYEEVGSTFRSLMWDIFQMRPLDQSPAVL